MRKVHRVLLTVGVVLALVAAACGDDDAEEAGDAEEADDATTAASCDGVNVSYMLGFVPNAQYAGFLLAFDRGYFEEEGVNLDMVPSGPTVNPSLQLAQGNVDMTDIPLSEGLNAAAGGADVKLVAQTAQQNPIRFITKEDVPLSDPTDLEGKVVEIQQAGGLYPELQGLLASAGLSDDDVTVVQSEFTTDDWIADRVDVFPYRIYGHPGMLEAEGISYPDDVNVLDPNEYGVGIADEGVYANAEFMAENPGAVACVLRASKRGWQDAIADPDAAKAVVAEYVPEGAFTERDIDLNTDATLEYVQTTPEGDIVEPLSIDVDYIRESADILMESGVVEGEVDVDDVIDTEPLEQAGS